MCLYFTLPQIGVNFSQMKKLIGRPDIPYVSNTMSGWSFHPFDPKKDAYDKRPFIFAKNIQQIHQLLKATALQVRGQLILKGVKQDYPNELAKIAYETEDMDFKKFVTIEYNSVNELEEILQTIKYKEEVVSRVVLYQHGYFIK